MQHLKEFNCAVDGCLVWQHSEFQIRVVRSVPAYRRLGREFPNLNTVFQEGVTTGTIETINEKLGRAKEGSVFKSWPDGSLSGEKEEEIALV